MKNMLTFVILFGSLNAFCQQESVFSTRESLDYYNLAVAAFQTNQLEQADSLFSLSIKYGATGDAFFNRAQLRLLRSDTCAACFDLQRCAMGYLDQEAEDSFKKYCLSDLQLTYFDRDYKLVDSTSDYKYYEEFRVPKFEVYPYGFFHKKNYKGTSVFNMETVLASRPVDICAAYNFIDSVKYFYFIYNLNFAELNGEAISRFQGQFVKYLLAKYNLTFVLSEDRHFDVKIYINPEGRIAKCTLNTDAFDFLEPELREAIREDVRNSFMHMSGLKPCKFFGQNISYIHQIMTRY
jgi:hypothetical protein